VGTIRYTFIHFTTYAYRRWWKRLTDERTVRNKTSIFIEKLAKGKDYTFILCLGNDAGRGPCAEKAITTLKTGNQFKIICTVHVGAIWFTIFPLQFCDFVVPSIPVVRTEIVNTNTIRVSWKIEDDGGNLLQRYSLRIYSVGLVVLATVAVSDDSYLVEDLKPETSYWFSVVAHSSSGDSDMGWSNETTTYPG